MAALRGVEATLRGELAGAEARLAAQATELAVAEARLAEAAAALQVPPLIIYHYYP